MKKEKTIHTSRTIMAAELSEVMNFASEEEDYKAQMEDNVFNKKTESSKKKTIGLLTQLYSFDKTDIKFRCLEDFWKRTEEEHFELAFFYAVSVDYLLKESVPYVMSVDYGDKVSIEDLAANINKTHKNRFKPKTLRSVAGNIASSWKKIGHVVGHRKNIRTEKKPTYITAAFAFLMAYLDDLRGDYLFDHPSVKALDASKEEILTLVKAASDRELLDYNRSGASTVISFEKYLNQLKNV